MDVSVKPEKGARIPPGAPIPKPIEEDLSRLKVPPATEHEAIAGLFGSLWLGIRRRARRLDLSLMTWICTLGAMDSLGYV